VCEAYRNVEKSHDSIELTRIFDQLNACEFPISAARMYYESKALEAFAVLVAYCGASALEENASPDSNIDSDFTSRVSQYIHENSKSELSIALLAKLACMSSSKLKYSFKRSFNKSIFVYITEVRMEKAKRLLVDTNLPIEGVASEVGYKKAGAFAAAFRKYAGVLPKEYRSAERAKFARMRY
jgi:AraC-like DNA-binding protein